uniref:C2H2-type domain-containing protein n=1 Tax=Caenorhabditis tropicalis TaxID=1561998 RepID=A0A1I7UFF9_9PELO
MMSCSPETSSWKPRTTSLLEEVIGPNQREQSSSSAINSSTFQALLDYYKEKTEKADKNTIEKEAEGNESEGKEEEDKLVLIKCEFCDAQFSKRNNFSRHMNRHTNSKHFKCKMCGKKFLRIDQMKNHVMAHVKKGIGFDCPVSTCDERFTEHSDLREHIDEHHKISSESPANCKTCSKMFVKADSLLIHFQTGHGELYEVAPNIENIKTEEDATDSSTIINSSGVGSSQEIVEEEVENRGDIEIVEVWPNRYQCDVCKLDYSSLLIKHMSIHMKPKAGLCCPVDTCQMPFNRHWELEVHVDKHHGTSSNDSDKVPTIKKEVDDTAPTVSSETVRLIKEEPEEKPNGWFSKAIKAEIKEESDVNRSWGSKYQCDVCLKFYSNSGNLRRHQRLHRRGLPWIPRSMSKRDTIDSSDENPAASPKRIKSDIHPTAIPAQPEVVRSRTTTSSTFYILDNEEIPRTESAPVLNNSIQEVRTPTVSPDTPFIVSYLILLNHLNLFQECEPCGIWFNDVTMFICHRIFHTNEHPFQCGVCRVQLNDKYQFSTHLVFNNHFS